MNSDVQSQAGSRWNAASRAPHPVFWVIAIALSVLALDAWFDRAGSGADSRAHAQPTASAGARGVFAFSGQLTRDSFGIHVVDVDAMTIWTYEYVSSKSCLRLAAARSWQYDRYLENLNACDLPPDAVEKMIEEQRKYKLQETESQMP